jgi:hypothetical protein
MFTQRRIIKEQGSLHILQVEQERTQTNQSLQGMKQTKNNTKTPREIAMVETATIGKRSGKTHEKRKKGRS